MNSGQEAEGPELRATHTCMYPIPSEKKKDNPDVSPGMWIVSSPLRHSSEELTYLKASERLLK